MVILGSVKRIVAFVSLLLLAAGSYGENGREPGRRENQALGVAAVFDANGAFVGSAQALDANFGVVIEINGAAVFVGIQRLSADTFANASATQFRWKAIDCTVSANCSDPLLVNCGGALCPARPSMAVRRGSGVAVYVASPSNSIAGNIFNPEWAIEAIYDLTLHHPEPLTVRWRGGVEPRQ